MVLRMMILQIAVFLVWSGMWATAKDNKDNKADVAAQSDPIMQALGKGVDQLDGVPDGTALQRRDWRYRVQSGDVLDLQFQFTPEFNQTATVQPDGYVTLKEIGDVHVEGFTDTSLPDGSWRDVVQVAEKAIRGVISPRHRLAPHRP